MPNFTIQFDAPLKSAKAAGAVRADHTDAANQSTIAPDDVAAEPVAELPVQPTVAVTPESGTAIEAAIKGVLAELSSQRNHLEATAAKYAVEVVRVFLGSTDELIEQRLQQNILRVLDRPETATAQLFVHSQCRESIQSWILENSEIQTLEVAIEVLVDDDLEAGDCRIDFGQSGRLAAMEQQLALVESKLQQAIRDEQSGDCP